MHGHILILENKDTMKDNIVGGILVEIGSDRASGSTKALAQMAKEFDMDFYTVDPDEGAYERSTNILKNIDEDFKAVQDLGENFLDKFDGEINLIYMDAFDNVLENWPHKQATIDTYKKRGVDLNNENSWKMHLEACQNAIDKIPVGCYICFDDTVQRGNEWEGKGKLAIPFLLKNGFDIIDNDYNNCLILQKEK